MVGLPAFSDGEAVIQIPTMDNYEYLEIPVKTELPYSLENRIGDIGLGVDILDDCELRANETVWCNTLIVLFDCFRSYIIVCALNHFVSS